MYIGARAGKKDNTAESPGMTAAVCAELLHGWLARESQTIAERRSCTEGSPGLTVKSQSQLS